MYPHMYRYFKPMSNTFSNEMQKIAIKIKSNTSMMFIIVLALLASAIKHEILIESIIDSREKKVLFN